jgi:predicted acyltransferase
MSDTSSRITDRLVSLDVFRGITIAGMVLVNNPGTWSSIHWPLEHAEWHGWTPTDLIFPFFLFIGWIFNKLFLSWASPINASLAFAICFILLWLGLMWVLYSRRIFIKV